MKICQVIGTVTLSQAHSSLKGLRWVLVEPMGIEELRQERRDRGESFVAVDQLGAGIGSRVAVSEGREAAMPFHPDRKPLDAYCACILDAVRIELKEGL